MDQSFILSCRLPSHARTTLSVSAWMLAAVLDDPSISLPVSVAFDSSKSCWMLPRNGIWYCSAIRFTASASAWSS